MSAAKIRYISTPIVRGSVCTGERQKEPCSQSEADREKKTETSYSSPFLFLVYSAISKHDAIRICSGQAVVDLSTAVKELVENSLVDNIFPTSALLGPNFLKVNTPAHRPGRRCDSDRGKADKLRHRLH